MPSRNLRKGRASLPQHIYHITICTHRRLPWFNDFYCGRLLVHELRALEQEQAAESLAWVVMPDHLHWLLQLTDKMTLSEAVKRLKGRTAVMLNRYHGRHGAVWQTGFHDHALRQEEDIRQIARYIIANPLRAGLVNTVAEYSLWDAKWL